MEKAIQGVWFLQSPCLVREGGSGKRSWAAGAPDGLGLRGIGGGAAGSPLLQRQQTQGKWEVEQVTHLLRVAPVSPIKYGY